MKTVIPVFISAATLIGCSGGFGTMDRIMTSWQGAPLDAAIAQWGYPDQEQVIAGHKIYKWYYEKGVSIPSTTTGTVNTFGNTAHINATTYGGGVAVGNCTRILEVNDQNIVTHTQWQGNNCPFAEGFEYAGWRRKGD
jgi:hypothetical protein